MRQYSSAGARWLVPGMATVPGHQGLTGFLSHLPLVPRRWKQRDPPRWRASRQIRIFAVGKKTAKESWAEIPVEEYTKRLAPMVALTCDYLKDDDALLRAIRNVPKGQWRIALDERGSAYTSEQFSVNLFRRLDDSGGRIALFVGGADGLPSEAKASVDQTISLSGLTFTHKLARLVLVEQIYRAFEIHKGTKYHK